VGYPQLSAVMECGSSQPQWAQHISEHWGGPRPNYTGIYDASVRLERGRYIYRRSVDIDMSNHRYLPYGTGLEADHVRPFTLYIIAW